MQLLGTEIQRSIFVKFSSDINKTVKILQFSAINLTFFDFTM